MFNLLLAVGNQMSPNSIVVCARDPASKRTQHGRNQSELGCSLSIAITPLTSMIVTGWQVSSCFVVQFMLHAYASSSIMHKVYSSTLSQCNRLHS